MKALAAVALLLTLTACSDDIAHGVSAQAGPCLSAALSFKTAASGSELAIFSSDTNNPDVAQSFQLANTTDVIMVQVNLIRSGTPQKSNMTVYITPDDGGFPSWTVAGVATLQVAHDDEDTGELTQNLKETPTYYSFPVLTSTGGTVRLSANTTYWIIVRADYLSSDVDVVKWVGSNSNGYSNGLTVIGSYNHKRWSNTAIGTGRDMNFGIVGGC